jgi:hypothetical protein
MIYQHQLIVNLYVHNLLGAKNKPSLEMKMNTNHLERKIKNNISHELTPDKLDNKPQYLMLCKPTFNANQQ